MNVTVREAKGEGLSAQHRDLQRKYGEVVGAQQRSSEESAPLRSELNALRNCVAEWQRKWDALRRTPARYYVDGFEAKTKKHSKY